MNEGNPGRKLKTTTTTLEIIDALVELEGARVTEIAKQLQISKGSASNHLHTLRNEGYVTAKGDEYHPSLKFTYIGEHAKQHDRAYELAAEKTRHLDNEIPFETTFIVEENGIGRYLTPEVRQAGRHDNFAFTGEEEYLHTIAAGKSILATFSRDRIEEILDQWGLVKKTENTITNRERFFEELDKVREQGYAINQQENRQNVYSISTAVHRSSGRVLGGMSVVTPLFRLKGDDFDREIYKLLFDQVNDLEEDLEAALETGS